MAPFAPRPCTRAANLPKLIKFIPFDPAKKTSEATAVDPGGAGTMRIMKGAYAAVIGLAPASAAMAAAAKELEAQGFRLLAVAAGSTETMRLAGLIALSDPPRADSAAMITEMRTLGVRTVMVTGDAFATAAIVARAVGLEGAFVRRGQIPRRCDARAIRGFCRRPSRRTSTISLRRFRKEDHNVAMCGDGANDAPALRQAQMGIAVSTATDVAKSAAGIVLTEPGLGGIVASLKEGRMTFQRILTYTLNSVTKKIVQVLFLAVGLVMTGHAILTPMLMVIIMLTGDFLGMSLDDRQCAPLSAAQCLANRQLDASGGLHGTLRVGLLHRTS